MRHFRTIVVGFPKINDAQGLQALERVQLELKFYCLLRGLMIGRFHRGSNDPGLWNPDFRPLRSPIPVLAIRELVENDAQTSSADAGLSLQISPCRPQASARAFGQALTRSQTCRAG